MTIELLIAIGIITIAGLLTYQKELKGQLILRDNSLTLVSDGRTIWKVEGKFTPMDTVCQSYYDANLNRVKITELIDRRCYLSSLRGL